MANETLEKEPQILTPDQETELNGFISEMEQEGRTSEEISNVVNNYVSKNSAGQDSDNGTPEGPGEGPVGTTSLVDDIEPKVVTDDFDYFKDEDYNHLAAAAKNFDVITRGRTRDIYQYQANSRGAIIPEGFIEGIRDNEEISDYADHDEIDQNGLINPKTGNEYTYQELGEINAFIKENDPDKEKIIEESAELNGAFIENLPVVAVYPEEQTIFDQVTAIPGLVEGYSGEEKQRILRNQKSGSYSEEDLKELGPSGIPRVLETDSRNLFNNLLYGDKIISNEVLPRVRRESEPELLKIKNKILKEFGIDTPSGLANASNETILEVEKAYSDQANAILNEKVNNDPNFIKRRRIYSEMAGDYLKSQSNKLGIQESNIPRLFRAFGNAGEDAWGSIVSLKGSIEGGGALIAGKQIIENNKILSELKDLDPDSKLPSGYYQGENVGPEGKTVGERITEIEDSSIEQRKIHVDKLFAKGNFDRFQKFFYQAEFLDGEVTMRDFISAASKQVPNMAISMVPVVGPLALEAGHIYTDVLFAGAQTHFDLPDGQEPSKEQLLEYLDTPEGSSAVDTAIVTTLASASLETLGNVAQLKAIFGSKAGKKVMGNLIKGNIRKAANNVGKWSKDQLLGIFGETVTEIGQETIQQGSQVYVSGNRKYWDIGALKETAAQTIASTSVLQGGGSIVVNSAKSFLNGSNPSQRETFIADLNKKVDLDLKKGNITEKEAETKLQEITDYNDALDIIPEDTSNDNKAAAAELVVKKFNLQREIEGKDAGAVKTKKDEIKLIDAQLDAIINDRAIPTSLEKNAEGNIPTKPSIADQKKNEETTTKRKSILGNLPQEETQEIKDLENQKKSETDPAKIDEINQKIEDVKNKAVQDGIDTDTRSKKKTGKIDEGIKDSAPDKTINKIDSWIEGLEKDKKNFEGVALLGLDPKSFHTAGILALKATKLAIKGGRSVSEGLKVGYQKVKEFMSFDEFKATVAEELGFYNTSKEQGPLINEGLKAFRESSNTTEKAISDSYKKVKGVFSRKEWNNYIHQKVYNVYPRTKFSKPEGKFSEGEGTTQADLELVEVLSYKGGTGGLDIKLVPTEKELEKKKALRKRLKEIDDKAGKRYAKTAEGKTRLAPPVYKEFKSTSGEIIILPTDSETGQIIRDFRIEGYTKQERDGIKSILNEIDQLHPSAFRAQASQIARKKLRGLFPTDAFFDESKSIKELTKELSELRPDLGKSKGIKPYRSLAEYNFHEGKIAKQAVLSQPDDEVKSLDDVTISTIKAGPSSLTKNIANNEIAESFKLFIGLRNNWVSLRQANKYNDNVRREYPSLSSIEKLSNLADLNYKLRDINSQEIDAKKDVKQAIIEENVQLPAFQKDLAKLKNEKAALEEKIRNEIESVTQTLGDSSLFSITTPLGLDKILPKIIRDEKGKLKPTEATPGVLNGIDFRLVDSKGEFVLDNRGKKQFDAESFKYWIQKSIVSGAKAKGGLSKKDYPSFFVEAISGKRTEESKAALKNYREIRKKYSTLGINYKDVPTSYEIPGNPPSLSAVNKKLQGSGLPTLPNNSTVVQQVNDDIRTGKISANYVRDLIVENIPTQDMFTAEYNIRGGNLKGSIRDFKLPPEVGSGSKIYRATRGANELTPGSVELVNPVVINEYSSSMGTQVYGAIVNDRLQRRDAQMDQGTTEAKNESNRSDRAADIRIAKEDQKKLIKRIKDPKTNSTTRGTHIQTLFEYETSYPEIVSKTLDSRGNTAAKLSKTYNTSLAPASKDSYETNGDGYRYLREMLTDRYKQADPVTSSNKKGDTQATLTLNEAIYELDVAFGRVKDLSPHESAVFSPEYSSAVSIARRAKGFKQPGMNEQAQANYARISGFTDTANHLDKVASNKATGGVADAIHDVKNRWNSLDQALLKVSLNEVQLSERPSVKKAFQEVVKRDWDSSKSDGTLMSFINKYKSEIKTKAQENAMTASLEEMRKDKPDKTCN